MNVLKLILPHGLVLLWQKAQRLRDEKLLAEATRKWELIRRSVLESCRQKNVESAEIINFHNIEKMFDLLEAAGVNRNQAIEGSMPKSSLNAIELFILKNFPQNRPLRALHVGNFLGISLCYLTGVLYSMHSKSLVVAIDPNIPHRGVVNPQSYVSALLSKTGLQRNVLLLAGYSHEKCVSNDGSNYTGNYDPDAQFCNEYAPENVIDNLASLNAEKFDLALVDGNHEGDYLLRELQQIKTILNNNSCVILDDVSRHWPEIRDVFSNASNLGFTPVFTDGRIGILKYLKAN